MAGFVLTDDMWERASRAHGWYEQDEAQLLFEAARGPWCEIGSWKGRSTSVLAQSGFPGWAVDTFTGSSEHGDNVDTYQDYLAHMADFPPVTTLRMPFDEAAVHVPDNLSLLHLDAEHTYEATRAAFDLFEPKLGPDAKIALHDAWHHSCRYPDKCAWPGVTRFALELCEHPDWILWDERNRLAVFTRR